MDNKQITTYIVATIKPWNITAFEHFSIELTGDWFLAQSPEELEQQLNKGLTPRYIFFPHWSWIVPEHIYKNYECVCFHMADVPYGRGGSPLQNLILRGHKATQLTALKMVKELDAGPVYLKRSLQLNGSAQEIFERVAALCYDLIGEIVKKEPIPLSQEGEVVKFKRRKPEQSKLPLNLSLDKVYDFIRMLDAESYPKAFLEYGSYRMEFTAVKKTDAEGELTATVKIRGKV